MEYLRNQYIKFLIDEVLRKSFATAFDAHHEVIEFSKTEQFDKSFHQWLKINKKYRKKSDGPQRIFS